jgi:glutamate-1-semialdehyde aminotransferase
MGVGTLALRYRHQTVDRAIRAQLRQGINFSLMLTVEVEVAELVRQIVPGAEMVRFSKTGADVTSAAVRLARAFTGRDKVLCCGYHGWHDWYIGVTPRRAGVPQPVAALTERFAYNDIDSLTRQAGRGDRLRDHGAGHFRGAPGLVPGGGAAALHRSGRAVGIR